MHHEYWKLVNPYTNWLQLQLADQSLPGGNASKIYCRCGSVQTWLGEASCVIQNRSHTTTIVWLNNLKSHYFFLHVSCLCVLCTNILMAQRGVLPEDKRKSISIDFCAMCKTMALNQNKRDASFFTLFFYSIVKVRELLVWPFHPGNGEVQEILTAVEMTGIVGGPRLCPLLQRKWEREQETKEEEKRNGSSSSQTVTWIRYVKLVKRK